MMMKTMWPDRRLIDLLQIEHPLVLAPMAGIGTVELAASVCVAGGLGSIGCAAMQPELSQDNPSVAVSFHFGLPNSQRLARVKAAGCRVMASATTVAEALWLEAHGVDIIIAQDEGVIAIAGNIGNRKVAQSRRTGG
jgi:NAD(P)H-dependent flavin oxidoreductase YrpB (nitropropane dioxygenase family)